MIIKPLIRSNVLLTAHPLGCRRHVDEQIAAARGFAPFEGPRHVLIIGGSSGYGLATRIALAVCGGANTINMSYESGPKGERSGTAGWWNNLAFLDAMKDAPTSHKDFLGDAFSMTMKQQVIAFLRERNIKLDLLVYSLAAGSRYDETTNELVRSHIKTIGASSTGTTIDIASLSLQNITVAAANEREIAETVYVMGGGGWNEWIDALMDADVLNQGFKTISYTYIGGSATERIYRSGTIGHAKEDLEQTAIRLDETLKRRYRGEALISSSKAVVTKASVFIPQMPIYVSCLYEAMARHGVDETILEHKYRLFKDMVYGAKRNVDDQGRIRMDHRELDPAIQKEVFDRMNHLDETSIFEMSGTKRFLVDFYKMNGFGYDDIDYDADVPLE